MFSPIFCALDGNLCVAAQREWERETAETETETESELAAAEI